MGRRRAAGSRGARNGVTIMAMTAYESANFLVAMLSLWLLRGAFVFTRERYEKLPEKFPLHFGLAGRADSWARKTKASVYLLPWIGVGLVLMCFAFFELPQKLDPTFDGAVMAVFFPLSAALAWFFARCQTGCVRGALGEADNIWPFIKAPGVALALCGLLMALFYPAMVYWSANMAQPKAIEITPCGSVSSESKAVEPTDTFDAFAPRMCVLTKWADLNGPTAVIRWIGPEGREENVFTWKTDVKRMYKTRPVWSCIGRDEKFSNGFPMGEWQIELSVMEKPGYIAGTKSVTVR